MQVKEGVQALRKIYERRIAHPTDSFLDSSYTRSSCGSANQCAMPPVIAGNHKYYRMNHMDVNEIKQNSKFLSLILRHQPEKIQVELDEEGWLEIDVLIANARKFCNRHFTIEMIERIVTENDKQRFSINPDRKRIRANQGHSLSSVQISFEPKTPPDELYHGTVAKFLPDIKASGLLKMCRNHVHLSADFDTATKVASRRGKPVILTISANEMALAGQEFYLSDNNVWLTEYVEPKYISFPNI